MEYCNLTDKELRRAVIKKFHKLQENSKVNTTILGINRSILPKRLILKKYQTEILKLKTSINVMKNALECIGYKAII